jgi:hypothetical protein
MQGTMYYDLTLAKEIMPKLTASAHAGYTDYKKDAETQLVESFPTLTTTLVWHMT